MNKPMNAVLHLFCVTGAGFIGLLICFGLTPAQAAPPSDETNLTLSTEARLRYDAHHNGQWTRGNDYQQGLLRGVLGADLRINSEVRIFGEIATGQVVGRRNTAAANFQNDASLQQLYVDAHGTVGITQWGAVLGRQEFAEGPKQLISLSDGPNLHRSWNGLRLYARREKFRVAAFDLRATRLGPGSFDEEINHSERLQGLNTSLAIASEGAAHISLDPFWMHSENPNLRLGSRVGLDARDTLGARLWGQRGELRFDWTLAHQNGHYLDRCVDAWGLFTVQSLALSNAAWKPRLTAHIDVASGGGAYGTGTLNGFNPLYASSAYLGEGQFLSLSNLLMVAPGIAIAPTPQTHVTIEYGFARRLNENDAAYAGGMRAYAGTQNVPGHAIGGLLRVLGTWSASKQWTLFVNYEQLSAGDVLQRAGLPSGSYGYVGATLRY
ncbi:MAG: alginate export family protein [Pseudomonadota bacterium]